MITFFFSGGGLSRRLTKKKNTFTKNTFKKSVIKKPKTKTKLNLKLKKGQLIKHGYVNVKKLSLAERKKAIDKAVKEYGRLTVIRKLNILRTLHKNKNPMLSKKHGVDMKYVQTKYKSK